MAISSLRVKLPMNPPVRKRIGGLLGFSEELAAVRINAIWGYINTLKIVVIPHSLVK
jgi:hypothetical protein